MGEQLWDREDLRAALRAGNWSPVLRAAQAAGWSQTEIAARVGIAQSQVSRLARGETRDPGIATIRALCDGLGIPRRYAGLTDDDTGGGDDTDRRQFLTTTLGAAAGVVIGPDVADERLVMLTTLSYRQIEQTTPARAMLPAVTGHLQLARQLAERAAGLVAWLHADLANPAAARSHYRLAVDAARRTGNALLPVYMQASLGQYAVAAGDLRPGLQLIRAAAAALPASAPATARAWLATLDAVALARLGDRAAWRMLDDAARHVDAADGREPVWPWVFAFDHDKLAQYRLVVAARLGGRAAARALPDRLPTVGRSPKQAAGAMLEHARATAAAGDVDEACRIAGHAHRLARQYGSERGRAAVLEFRDGLTADTAAVRELDDQLLAAYTEARP